MIERVVDIADACIRHLNKLANHNGTASQKDAVSTNLCSLFQLVRDACSLPESQHTAIKSQAPLPAFLLLCFYTL